MMMGSLEIITSNGESIGVPGANITPATVPTIVGALYGISALVTRTPVAAPGGRVPVNQWRGVDAANQPVDVKLWPEVEYDPAALGLEL